MCTPCIGHSACVRPAGWMVVATDGGVECATPARPDRRDERGGDRSGDAETPVRGDVNARVQGEPDRGVRVTFSGATRMVWMMMTDAM